jgi:hypothetical protein
MKMMTASVVPAMATMATMTAVPTAVAAAAMTTAMTATALGENEGRGKCCRRGNRAGCDKGN